ncbi:MAG TPA: tetratricopeptide repeat protein [Bacteroidales bacterium]|nr:tetratricopeptide repeat protein [Bacteroidales bacterium]MBP7874326.1 tetratricopeptide repeat protein [Bacteroidales bacterium]MCZ2282288.1 tetratricopeptide repeat protein [Bacteroidales bacterium]HPX34030.1 tetratricopeptide repeat protein [Bacteroidales bacterium]HQB47237.1 tetratricopeptide repeat protein [Bacteroidales bacterium]
MTKIKNTVFKGNLSHRYFSLFSFIAIVGSILLVISCSTKKNSFTSRTYNNLVSHYNTYWNGRESFNEGVRNLERDAKDNYTTILPVFKFGNEQEAQAVAFNMDRAIEKSSKVILRHSMYFQRKEYVRRVKDSYMLIGKSYLYKREYPNARRTFEWISGFYKDEAVKYDADLWLAMTYNQTGEFEKSSMVLDKLNKDIRTGIAPAKTDRLFQMIYADYYILQNDYQPSIKYLKRAIELNSRKKDKNRLRFILAQVHQEIGDMKEAARLYQLLIRKNPPFEMSVNAKINLAKTYDTKRSNRNMIVKTLEKLLKDHKNSEYRDQIYYALADMYAKDNQTEKVIEYLALSVATSVSNDYQQTLSSLKLADIYFEQPDYIFAQAYYDTAMQVMPNNFPNYKSIKEKTEVLTELITNLRNISIQDSLQNMAKMPEAERNKIIDEKIRKIVEEEKRLAEEQREAQRTVSMLEQTNRMENRNLQQSGGWYFYNPSAMSFGYTEFINKWGRRKLEDLWRLSNKQASIEFDELAEGEEGENGAENDSTLKLESDPKKREFYLQNLPLTEEAMEASQKIIENALFEAGYIYKDGLQDNEHSIQAFEELIEKFPEHENRLMVFYQLYKNWEEADDRNKADYYKNLIIRDFPETDYAKILLDPNYNLVVQARLDAASNLYYDTYSAYMNNQFYLVINNSNLAQEQYQDSELIAKFEFLKGLSFGKLQDVDTMRTTLEDLIANYPESSIKPLAQDILSRISQDETGQLVLHETSVNVEENEITGENPEEEFTSIYSANNSSVHFYGMIVDASQTNINALKVRLSDFNANNFRLSQLKINSIVFDNDLQLVTVGNFENAEKAMVYYNSVLNNDYITSPLEGTDTSFFVITTDNYPLFYREKEIQGYMKFFERTYLE